MLRVIAVATLHVMLAFCVALPPETRVGALLVFHGVLERNVIMLHDLIVATAGALTYGTLRAFFYKTKTGTALREIACEVVGKKPS